MTLAGDAPQARYEKGKLYDVSVVDLRPDPDQPRKVIDPDALSELAASIKAYGVLQPLLFREGDQGWLYIVSGERRYLAAQSAGLLVLPAICVAGNHAEIALVENLQRQDLTCVEEAEALKRLMDEQRYTQEQLGGVIGKAQNTISETLSLARLPQEIRDACRGDRTISRSALVAIARRKQARGMVTAYNAYKAAQQKGKTARTRKDPNDPQAAWELMDKAMTRLQALDPSAWTVDDAARLRTALTDLRTGIDRYLAATPATAPEIDGSSPEAAVAAEKPLPRLV